jgi:iron-sulfur cluster repair protein YtfE (RIC family)
MQDTLMPQPKSAPAVPGARHDIYRRIHKAMRRLYADTLTALGNVDPDDAAAVQHALRQTGTLFEICEVHYADEERFVHPMLERAQPGVTARVEAEHRAHRETLEQMRERIAVAGASSGATRAQAVARLYRTLALYMAEDFAHMEVEDVEFNAILWRHYSDAELMAVEAQIVSHVPPQLMAAVLPWMIGALNAPERTAFLGGARRGMPPEVFGRVLEIARRELVTGEWAKLARALQLPED